MPAPAELVSYTVQLTTQYEAVRAAMHRVVAAEMRHVVPPLRVLLAFYVSIQFTRFALLQTASAGTFLWALIRALVIVFFLTRLDAFHEYIATPLFETFPSGGAAIVTGADSRLKMPELYEVVRVRIDSLTADVRTRNTAWTTAALSNAIITWVANGSMQFWLAVQAYVWLASIRLLAIAICLIVWFLPMELFESTRGFWRHWIGAIVGIITFQIASSIFMQISLHSQLENLERIRAASTDGSVDMMIARLVLLGNSIFGDALTMLGLPAICAVGGGVGAHYGATRAAAAIPASVGRYGMAASRIINR